MGMLFLKFLQFFRFQPTQKIDRQPTGRRSTKILNIISIITQCLKFVTPPTKFMFVHQKHINETELQQPRHLWDDLATRLERGIYWVQPNGKGGSRCWNLILLKSYLAFGIDSQQHSDLVAECVATLSQVQKFAPGENRQRAKNQNFTNFQFTPCTH
jgi:hypothetical protein